MADLTRKPLALTQGDPAGIGPEIALKAWHRRGESGLPPFIFLGDPRILAARAEMLGLDIPIEITAPEAALERFDDKINIKNK